MMESSNTIINIPHDVLIVKGYVEIQLPNSGITVRAKVKQLRGNGVADAIHLKVPSEKHLEIINILRVIKPDKPFKANDIIRWINVQRGTTSNSNGIRRPICELFTKGLLIKVSQDHKGFNYVVNQKYMNQILVTKQF